MAAFDHILVNDFPETVEGDLVVAAAEKLPEPRVFPCALGKVLLIRPVTVSVKAQWFLLNIIVVVLAQRFQRNYMGEALHE